MGANNRINLTLGINADATQAKKELQSLQTSINNLVTLNNSANPLKGFTASTTEAIHQVSKLSAELASVTNGNGTLNIGKLANLWKANGQTLEQYRNTLMSLGPDGERAFRQLATAIANAQQPVRELDGMIGKFAKGLANTAMWTLQSNAIHAVQSALSGAYHYAQQLNKGLTDISIVSDLNTRQLTEFAKTANQMAKDLSASTSDVVSGALIYYQAGLSDEEVIKRTETTIKLAQTSGESAEQISSYMTAIWNNFYDGSKSVEYYADAISYLGAVTAASNADIAEGMQAFSAVADTVGLSFEYGASALTLLRDITQQSASTIGNSLKTIFARLSSVQQGETLEDGVDLNKYSKALEKVGVNILDVNGQLKSMDTILDDLASKWETLDDANKTALATTVGGVRQYNNLISLMDNYGRFQELVAGSRQSDGYLQEQSEKYAESWEAALNRVQAAWQGIFDTLIDDKSIITITNAFAKILNIISEILDKSGGLTTLLPMLVSLLGIGFNDNLAKINTRFKEILDNTIHFKDTLKEAANLRAQAAQQVLDFSNSVVNPQDQGTINELTTQYHNYIDAIERGRSEGVDESVIQAQFLEAERYYNLLTSIQEKIQQIENLRASSVGSLFLPAGELESKNSWTNLHYQGQTSGVAEQMAQMLQTYKNAGSFVGETGAQLFKDIGQEYAQKLQQSIDTKEISAEIGTQLGKMQEIDQIDDTVVDSFIAAFRNYIVNPDQIIQEVYETFHVSDAALEGIDNEARKELQATRDQIRTAVSNTLEAGRLTGEMAVQSEHFSQGIGNATAEVDKNTDAHHKNSESLGSNIGYIVSATNSLIALTSALNSAYDGFIDLTNGNITDGLKRIGSGLVSAFSSTLMLTNALENSKMLAPLITKLGTAFKAGATGAEAMSAGIAGIVSTIALAIIAVKIFIALYEQFDPAHQLDRLKAVFDQLNQAAHEATEEFDSLTSTLDGLGDKYNNIDQLTEGTQAWSNAVHDLNEELLELVDKYDLVYGQDYVYQNGTIRFTPSGEDKMRQGAETKANQTQQAAQNAKLGVAYGEYSLEANKYDKGIDSFIKNFDDFDSELTDAVEQVRNQPQLVAGLIEGYLNANKDTLNGTRQSILKSALNTAQTYDFADEQNSLYNSARALIQGQYEPGKFSDQGLDFLTDELLNRIANAPKGSNIELEAYLESIGGESKPNSAGHVEHYLANGTKVDKSTLQSMYQANWAVSSLDVKTAENLTKDIFGTAQGKDHDVGQRDFSESDTAEMERYAEVVKRINKNWEDWNATALEQQSISEDLATDYINFNKGLSDVIKNYDNYITNLREADKSSMDYINTVAELRNDFELMFDIDPSSLTDEFFDEHNVQIAKDLEAAAKGDFDALYDLQELLARNIFNIDTSKLTTELANQYQTAIDNINNSEQWDDIQIGASFDADDLNTDFGDAMEALLAAGEITAAQLQNTLDAIGWEPQIDWEEMTVAEAKDAKQVGYLRVGNEYQQVTDEMHLTDETHVWVPRLNRSKTTFKGSPKSRINQSNRSGAAKNAKSSGGGGSSKNKQEEVDRYHEINSRIEQNTHLLQMVNTAEDQAYGPDKLALIEEKIKLLEQEGELYKALRDEAQGYYDADRARLANTYGAQFNPDGSIANYDTWYRQFVDKYNSGSMDDDAWKALQDAIKKYEDSLKQLNDANKKLQDNEIAIFNEKLDAIEYRLKTVKKLIQQDIDYLDYMIEQLDKDMYDTADVLALLGDKMGKIYEEAGHEREAIEDIFKLHGLGSEDVQAFLNGQTEIADVLAQVGELTQKEIDDLQSHQSALLDYNKTLIQIREESYEKISESINEFNDQIERQIDIIDDLDGLMSHYKNIIDIVGKDVLGVSDEMLENMDKLAVTAAQSSLEISTNQLEHNREILEDLYRQRNEMAETASDEDKRLMDKEIQKQEDEVRRLTESWATSWENALKVAETAFKNSIERTTDAFSKAMAGSLGSLDNLQEAFDQQKQLNERYLPTYQRIYELNKLTRDVNNAIDNTSNIAGKERLLKLQQEILDRQQSGAEITEYEVGMLQRRLELEQARIAMEDAQNAKNMVRMTRDNEGNWSYVYTADASRMAEAQQNYEDKLYDLKKYNQESMAAFEEAMWKAVQDYKDSIADLNLTDEERLARIKAFQEEWVAHNARMLNMALNDANWIIGEYNAGIDDLQDNWSDLISGQITDYDSLGTMMKTFEGASTTMIGNVGSAFATWKINHERIFEAAGSSVDTFAKQVEKDMKDAGEAMLGNGDDKPGLVGDAKKLGEDLEKVLGDILTYLDEWTTGENGYFAKIDTIADKHTTWYNSIQSLIEQYKGLKTAAQEAASVSGPQGTGVTPNFSNSGGGNGATGSPSGYNPVEPKTESTKTTPVWTYTQVRYKSNPGNVYLYNKGAEPSTTKKAGWQWRKLDQNQNPMSEWIDMNGTGGGGGGGNFMVKADTGMYTGSWGPEGKLAMLHEKELVLNKQDTANMLATVGFVRDITQMLSLNASVASAGLGNLMMGNVNAGSSYLDQNVTIHAEFPNATNHSEIEEAFNNLIGLASQYAGRKQ